MKFTEMLNLEISKYVKKKPTFFKDGKGNYVKTTEDKWLDYLEWAQVLILLYTEGKAEDVAYGLVPNGSYVVFSDEKGNNPFVKVWVMIDGREFTLDYPVTGKKAEISQHDIHYAAQRGFVKCVAINTGLGLQLWLKEEQVFVEEKEVQMKEKPASMEENKAIIKLFEQMVRRSKSNDNAYLLLNVNKAHMMKIIESPEIALKNDMIDTMNEWLSLSNEDFNNALAKVIKDGK